MFPLSFLLYREVSWCSWLSHHFHVVRVPGSNPGGTIFAYYNCACRLLSFFFLYPQIYAYIPLSYLPFPSSRIKKQRREVSINRPASYEPAALPLRHPAFYPSFPLFSTLSPVSFQNKNKKLHRRESNPGRKRERLACYQLHHNGFLCFPFLSPLVLTASFFLC